MTLWTLDEAAAVLGGQVAGDGSGVPVALAMDSRSLLPGSCFLAIRGQRDGHAFAAQAVERGASSLLVDHELALDVPQLVVQDTLSALHRWGQARLAAVRPGAVFAITGSVGKTSTKELLAAATGGWKTPGNRNNTLGLPEALATLPAGLGAAVLEMGMSTPFEIAKLTEIAPPDYGLITNIGTAHMENFVKGQEGIARAKGELVAGLKPGGTWVHLASDSWCRWVALQPWASRAKAVAVGQGSAYGWDAETSLGPHGERFTLRLPEGGVDVRLRMRGSHQVRNAALAGVLAVLAGFEPGAVARGLATVEPEPGRGRLHALRQGGWLLDESYNASQDSILACAASLGDLEGGETVAVVGSMRELGPRSESLHRETGEGLRALGLRRLLAYGDQAKALVQGFGPGGQAFPDYDGMRDDPEGLASIPEGARILVKGSRFWQAERAVAWLLEHLGTH
jgi:UDP-N-acetylmuramoyl-tripeptide--D-alanyl-D-alanine ligase